MGAVFRSWDTDHPLLILLDVRLQGGFVSAYALVRARQVSYVSPDLVGRTAVLIASPIAAQVIGAVVRSGLEGTRHRRVFGEEARAIQWLLEGLQG